MALSFNLPLSLLPLFFSLSNLLLVHSQTTTFSFNSFDSKPNDATYQGDASPSGDQLRLTSTNILDLPEFHRVGRVVYSRPVQFWEPRKESTFKTTFTFTISKVLLINTIGDGIAFFMAPVGAAMGSDGGSLGIFNSDGEACNLFAVEFDTFTNYWDPDYRHMGIDISSTYSRTVKQIDDFIGETVTATVSYEANTVTVVADVGGKKSYNMSYYVDLSTVLPPRVQVGISAATGNFGEYNYLHSWNFTSSVLNPYEVM